MVNFPGSLDSLANPTASTNRDDPGFQLHAVISTLNDIAEALEAKLGIGASAAVANSVLAGIGTGQTAYSTVPTIGGTVTVGGLSTAGTVAGAAVTASGALTGGSASISGNGAIVAAPVSGTPVQHGLYRESVVKGWIKVTVSAGTPSIAGSYNVTSITDTGVGLMTITWDRDFASTAYAVVSDLYDSAVRTHQIINAPLVGASGIVSADLTGTPVDPLAYMSIAIGPQ